MGLDNLNRSQKKKALGMLNSKHFVKGKNRRPYGLCQIYLTSLLLVAENTPNTWLLLPSFSSALFSFHLENLFICPFILPSQGGITMI